MADLAARIADLKPGLMTQLISWVRGKLAA
jgi:hypothetical protein